jgi:hypothetical protein
MLNSHQRDTCTVAHRMPGLVVLEPPGTLDTKGAASPPPRLLAEPEGDTPRGRVGLSVKGDCVPDPAARGLPAGAAAAGPCRPGGRNNYQTLDHVEPQLLGTILQSATMLTRGEGACTRATPARCGPIPRRS